MKINISTIVDPALMRQSEDGLGRWKDAQFTLNNQDPECDFWVVVENIVGQQETKRCDPRCTLLVTTEPPEVKTYRKNFTRQFDAVLTCQNIQTPNKMKGQQALPWMVGIEYLSKKTTHVRETYESFKNSKPNQERSEKISVIASKKSYTKDHAQRDVFIGHLKREFGDQVCIYGNGYENILDKAHALYPNKYQIVMENTHMPDYWTEKLSDAFLSYNFPFYFGCTNISDYFDPASYMPIDIYKPEAAIAIIRNGIEENLYSKRLPNIIDARDKVLDTYNFFEVVYSIAKKRLTETLCPQTVVIRSQESFVYFKGIKKLLTKILR